MQKNKMWIVMLLVATIAIAACAPKLEPQEVPEEETCPEPLIRVGDQCCTDNNNNFVCDDQEVEEKEPTTNQLEEQRIKAGERLLIDQTDLPLKVYMQRKTHVIYTNNEEYIFILDELNKDQLTVHYGNDRYKIDISETMAVGPLLFKYLGVDPPQGGNFAVIQLFEKT